MSLTKTDKTTLAGLYISKYNQMALQELGFTGMWEAFNVIGYSLGSSPASVKNYRDEFDRLFPDNPRKGWQRPLKARSQRLFSEFQNLDFLSFTDLIKSFLIPHYEDEKVVSTTMEIDKSESVAKRLITGKAAEEYFRVIYPSVNEFKGYELKDTTYLACGFDFKLSHMSDFYCVEVKGLNRNSGSILVTEKEYSVAKELKNRYCLFIVKNFVEKPSHFYYFDPLNAGIRFAKSERNIIQVSYLATL